MITGELTETRSCRRCTRQTPEPHLDQCVRCGSIDLCPKCILRHDCDHAARLHNAATIRKDAPR